MTDATNPGNGVGGDDVTDAGPFASWLDDVRAAIDGRRDSDVACGTCTACCASSQFVVVGPDEHDALAHLPEALLAPAPGAPPGYRVLGYDDRGRCPMLGDAGCTIYEHRPRTCRTYDCRIFPAAGVVPVDKPAIAARAARWRFSHPTAADRQAHDAVRAAAEDIEADPTILLAAQRPRSPTHLAIAAVVHADT